MAFFLTAVSYQWYKGDEHFVRPDLHSYMFISRNGKLYFSVVSTNDAGNYRCIVQLSSNNGAAIGTNQPPSRISRPIPLVVENSGMYSSLNARGKHLHNRIISLREGGGLENS